MNQHDSFRMGDKLVEFRNVVGFEETPRSGNTAAADVNITIYLRDGSDRTVEGADGSEAFMWALDGYLGGNLF